MRLNRFLAQCGLGSRRQCDELIRSGRVAVNGQVVLQMATQVSSTDRVAVDGRLVRPVEKKLYVMLNKPAGVVTTARDERRRRTVLDLVPGDQRLFPVGRLDKDTEGLLLLTNDGELAYRLTHPRFEIEKVYRVRLDRRLSRPHRRRLEQGIDLEGRLTSKAVLKAVDRVGWEWLVTIHEGRKRQVRRMFAALGYRVTYLRREQVGPLQLGGLSVGSWRFLTTAEVTCLKRAVELDDGDSE